MKAVFLSIIFIFLYVSSAISQNRFGQVNSTRVLSELKRIKIIDVALSHFQDSLNNILAKKALDYRKSFESFNKENKTGNYSPQKLSSIESELAKKRSSLVRMEQKNQQAITSFRKSLIEPVLTAFDKIVRDVGKEFGFAFIFDSGEKGLLFADGEDISEEVKRRLKSVFPE
jgi:Skp family chaperone for outer membrane proteins